MGGIVSALQFILGKIVSLASWIGQLFVSVFTSLWHVVTDLVAWSFEGVLDIAVSAVSSLDWSEAETWGQYWSLIPAETFDVFSAIGLGTAFTIVASAIGIRFALQLVPFTRLGS